MLNPESPTRPSLRELEAVRAIIATGKTAGPAQRLRSPRFPVRAAPEPSRPDIGILEDI
jgi:hypothetical protein